MVPGFRHRTGGTRDLINPADGSVIGQVAVATPEDIDRTLAATHTGFQTWRKVSAWDRANILRKAMQLISERGDAIAELLTRELGKPLVESRAELERCIEVFDWCAAETVRSYGRTYPQRASGGRRMTLKEAVGPVAAFTPWNFPVLLSCRKLAAALGAGCSIILNPANEAPSAIAAIVQILHDAGVPTGVIAQLTGNPAQLSQSQVESPVIAKVSLTGSIPVGKLISGMAGAKLKPVTMELGGHAPVIILDDADIERAADEVVRRANALPYGLAAYAFTSSLKFAIKMADDLEAGWIGINEFTPALAEAPFSGHKESGLGQEGGPEGFDAYLKTKFVSQFAV